MNFSEKYGKNIDEAVNLALEDLGLTKDEVEIEILEQPSKGFLGIGSKLAKVRVEKKQAKEKEPVKKQAEKVKETKIQSKESIIEKKIEKREETGSDEKINPAETQTDTKSISQKRPDDLQKVDPNENKVGKFILDIFKNMNLNLSIECLVNDESIYIIIEGKDSGTVIGKRGQTLDSLQYLASLVANKNRESSKYIRVILDAENYREKREKTLVELANRLADKVVRTKRSVRLEPMNPYERKVIHATLQSNLNVVTRSEGEEPYRRVIIDSKFK